MWRLERRRSPVSDDLSSTQRSAQLGHLIAHRIDLCAQAIDLET